MFCTIRFHCRPDGSNCINKGKGSKVCQNTLHTCPPPLRTQRATHPAPTPLAVPHLFLRSYVTCSAPAITRAQSDSDSAEGGPCLETRLSILDCQLDLDCAAKIGNFGHVCLRLHPPPSQGDLNGRPGARLRLRIRHGVKFVRRKWARIQNH